jgi:hypothetical protein
VGPKLKPSDFAKPQHHDALDRRVQVNLDGQFDKTPSGAQKHRAAGFQTKTPNRESRRHN